MALINCKECGEKVSDKAKACPKCGAKLPKKTSALTWLVMILVVLVVIIYNSRSPSSTSSAASASSSSQSTTPSSKPASQTKPAPAPEPAWETFTGKDEMTGKLSAYATSPSIGPNRKMDFPYRDVTSWMGIGCTGGKEWAYFGFTTEPNLTNAKTESGYHSINTRIKWDDSVEDVSLTQDWGAKSIHFTNDSSAINKVMSSKKVLLELQWHGNQSVYFQYSLNGSSKAISEMRAKCAGK